MGVAVCLGVLGTTCWCARDAEPVLVGVDIAVSTSGDVIRYSVGACTRI